MRSVSLTAVGGVLVLLLGCGGGTQTSTNPPALVSVQVTAPSATITAGQIQQMTATGTYSSGSPKDLTGSVTWGSSNANVASVAAGGMLAAKAAGTCTITAKMGAVAGSLSLTVSPSLVSISITPSNPSIAPGTTQQFIATGNYSDGSTQNLTGSANWSSSNTSVANVSSATPTKGLAQAIAGGSSTITATSGSISGTASLTVTAASPSSIIVTPAGANLPLGLSQQFTATADFSDGTSQDVTGVATWNSSSTAVASITTSGLATARNVGATSISATFASVSNSSTLTVNAANLNSISIQPANGNIAPGTKIQFTAIGTFNDGGTRDITHQVAWSSSNPSAATIGASSGIAFGAAPGLVTIQATLGSATISVPFNVSSAKIVSIAVTPTSATIPTGGRAFFIATGTFDDSTSQDISTSVVWSSSNPAVATVGNSSNNQGQAIGVSSGTTTISASFTYTGAAATGTATLTVSSATLTSIALTPRTATLAPASGLQYSAIGTFSDGNTQFINPLVTWTSSNNSVATLNPTGFVTGQAAGVVTITVQSGSISATASLLVESATLTSLQITPQSSTVPATIQTHFKATGTFSNGDTQDLTGFATWTSSSSTVATISNVQTNSGVATGIQPGSTTISAVFNGQVGTASLTVTNATLTAITVTPGSASISVGSSQQFAATGTFSDSSVMNITGQAAWSSSNATIATIISRGVASGGSAGTSTITAALNGVNGTAILTVQ